MHWFVKWLLYTVGLTVAFTIGPALLFTWFYKNPFSLNALLGHGELLPTTAGLCASALGNLHAVRPGGETRKGTVTWVGILVIFLAAVAYTMVSGKFGSAGTPDPSAVVTGSIIAYVFAVACSGVAAYFSR
jgi:hypothetical protein